MGAPKSSFTPKTRGFTVKPHHGRVMQKPLVHHPLVPRGLVESKHLRGGFSRGLGESAHLRAGFSHGLGESAHLRAGLRATTNQHHVKQMPSPPVTNIAPLPMGLQSYCSSAKGSMHLGTHVEADWKGYGPYYEADVTKVHKDGTVDLKYADGFVEDHVP